MATYGQGIVANSAVEVLKNVIFDDMQMEKLQMSYRFKKSNWKVVLEKAQVLSSSGKNFVIFKLIFIKKMHQNGYALKPHSRDHS